MVWARIWSGDMTKHGIKQTYSIIFFLIVFVWSIYYNKDTNNEENAVIVPIAQDKN